MLSPLKRQEVLTALSRGAVPARGLDVLAVGMQRYEAAIDGELQLAAAGGGVFKAVRGEYGTGKTFFVRWLTERARRQGFATSEVQISENDTPLHKLETVYRRAMEQLATEGRPGGALPDVVDAWFYRLEQDAEASGDVPPGDTAALDAAVEKRLERRLAEVSRKNPAFAAALRGYGRATQARDAETAQGLLAWVSAQPNVAASVKRSAGIKGEIDNDGAMNALRGVLTILRDSGHAGLVLVLDEAETLQRVRTDSREKSLNALRQLIDDLGQNVYPGLYVVITGTPAFFDGSQGVQRLAPLAQRLHTDFGTDPKFDNPQAIQLRLHGMDVARLTELGLRVRDLFAEGSSAPDRVLLRCDDALVAGLAQRMAGRLGGQAAVAPRLFLKKLVADVLQRIDQFPEFDPREHYKLTLTATELRDEEREALSPDDIELDL